MSELLVENKSIVVPGEVLAIGMDYLPSQGTYRLNETIRAEQLGLLLIEGKILKIMPLTGKYYPKVNDVVIGKVIDVMMSGWRFDINCAYSAVLPLKDASYDFIRKGELLNKYFDLEDYVLLRITQVSSQNLIDVSAKGPGLKKLKGGTIIKVGPYKVPRIIGKKGSMVSMIKKATECQIIVGQNGLIWINGEPEMEVLAIKAIHKIEREAHISGLTDRIKEFLEKETGKKIIINSEQEKE